MDQSDDQRQHGRNEQECDQIANPQNHQLTDEQQWNDKTDEQRGKGTKADGAVGECDAPVKPAQLIDMAAAFLALFAFFKAGFEGARSVNNPAEALGHDIEKGPNTCEQEDGRNRQLHGSGDARRVVLKRWEHVLALPSWRVGVKARRGAIGSVALLALAACSPPAATDPDDLPAAPATDSPAPAAPLGQWPKLPKPAPPEAPVDPAFMCLAYTIYHESRGQPRQGQAAVGHVVLNRVADRRYPNTICAVVQQGGETPPCQFNWRCDGKKDTPTERRSWRLAQDITRELYPVRRMADPTFGALSFHHIDVAPEWSNVWVRTATIGDHHFYRPE